MSLGILYDENAQAASFYATMGEWQNKLQPSVWLKSAVLEEDQMLVICDSLEGAEKTATQLMEWYTDGSIVIVLKRDDSGKFVATLVRPV